MKKFMIIGVLILSGSFAQAQSPPPQTISIPQDDKVTAIDLGDGYFTTSVVSQQYPVYLVYRGGINADLNVNLRPAGVLPATGLFIGKHCFSHEDNKTYDIFEPGELNKGYRQPVFVPAIGLR